MDGGGGCFSRIGIYRLFFFASLSPVPPPPVLLSLLPGVTAAPASRLTSASESTQAMLNATLYSISAAQSARPYSCGGREADSPGGGQTHLIDVAFYPLLLFKGTKLREQLQTVCSLCSVPFSSGFPYCPELFMNALLPLSLSRPSPRRSRSLFHSESLLWRLGHFRHNAGASGLHLQ